MGLDIQIGTDNYKEVYTTEYFLNDTFLKKMRLSRTFCNFMSRRHMVSQPAELDQIGKLTNVDISPIYQMEEYMDEDAISQLLAEIEPGEEREKMAEKMRSKNESFKGNIDRVLEIIDTLITSLLQTDGLPKKITSHGYDTLGNDFYFSNFSKEKSDDDFRDYFGEDIRNFKRFLEYAKSKGTTIVYFTYG